MNSTNKSSDNTEDSFKFNRNETDNIWTLKYPEINDDNKDMVIKIFVIIETEIIYRNVLLLHLFILSYLKFIQIVELKKDSNVFLNKNYFNIALDKSLKQTDLARALMLGIFTKEAVTTCSLGKKKVGDKKEERPPLNQLAVEVLVCKFVVFY